MEELDYSNQTECSSINSFDTKRGISLFTKHLYRINRELELVNEYYTPKNSLITDNNNKTEEIVSNITNFNESQDPSIFIFDELYKITMDQIETIRKTHVRNILSKKAVCWERQRKEQSNVLTANEELKRLRRKQLVIDRNYASKIIVNDDQLKTKLFEVQNRFDQKLLKVYNEQLEKNMKESESKHFSFKVNENEEKNKFTNIQTDNKTDKVENNVLQTKSDINSFSFKLSDIPKKVDNDPSKFSFKIDKEIPSSSTNQFSFKLENISPKPTLKNVHYDFKKEYRHFLENHLALQDYLINFENAYSAFISDDSLKSLRQELTKSINTPVNTISSLSAWHMQDKFEKLDSLLNCKTVKTANSMISANCHKDALSFCMDTLAKKVINFGELVTSVKKETAFEVASVIIELWIKHPDFGVLLYARFKQRCPSLIPYSAAKTEEETDEEYYKSLGYIYKDGIIEKQDKYVTRMTGIIRLFAALIVTESKSGKALGIAQAWMLLSATVNMVPQLDITAVLIQEVLVFTGYELKLAYGKQFIKMLRYIESKYMKKIDEVTPEGRGGPVQRLKTFLSKTIQTGFIDKPKGIIPYNFW
ncbi:mRNA export factor Gle1-like [Daktulosphaira vitifoliae]|uniref:mRNA export factor Gle1-like n=1 Tax=Daktulosphaira vitifoliae TaxID=58002 RepID=UPI0021AAE67D|nr:mRNA export factor Gle1-like [Daktulosphaira vitifoliae]